MQVETNIKEKIIEYIRRNRVSTTEVADCLGKTGVIEGIFPINQRHFEVGEIDYYYAVGESNWCIHQQLSQKVPENKIIFIDAIDVNGRALIGDIVSKYALLYLGNHAIVTNGKMRDVNMLIKENYSIWCSGFSPVGCFNSMVDSTPYAAAISEHREKYQGAIAVCDDSGVVLIPKEKIETSFLEELVKIEEQEDIWYDCIDRRKWSTFKTICQKAYLDE